jgi:hypothetical protein
LEFWSRAFLDFYLVNCSNKRGIKLFAQNLQRNPAIPYLTQISQPLGFVAKNLDRLNSITQVAIF